MTLQPSNPTTSQHPADLDTMQPGLAAYPPVEKWEDWTEYESRDWPNKSERSYMLVPTSCFNCESACGLLAYVDRESGEIRKFEGNPLHPGSRGRNCAKGPATLNQIQDPDRILYPMKRAGARGAGKWKRISWDEALNDIAGRIRSALKDGRKNEIMYHVGRPGEDGYTNRVLAAWGIDGLNSHTNICSAGARCGYALWMGIDRPSPDYANAKVILLISAHLESGHYFNPHAQRILEAKGKGAKIIVMDPRLSNTATHADHWLPTYPGSEPAVLLAIAHILLEEDLFNRDFVRRWVNWEEFMRARHPSDEVSFEGFVSRLKSEYAKYTPAFAEAESGVPAATIVEVAHLVGGAGTALSAHSWRAAAAGNLHGWMTARALFFLNVLTGSIATKGGTTPNTQNKFVPKAHTTPGAPDIWNELSWPKEFPLSFYEMSFLLPHFLKDGRGKLAVYFTRVYNPVWTNPDGFTWIDVLKDESLVECHTALTPTWSETAWFADYVLPVGLGSERHDLHSYETHSSKWIGFRQPVLRAFRDRMGRPVTDTRDVNPGEVWEENEFWIELSWRIDPDGSLGIRKHFESPYEPGKKISIDEYYRWIFENSVPGLPETAAEQDLTPLEYMRRFGAFEIAKDVYETHEKEVARDENHTVHPETGVVADGNGVAVGVDIEGVTRLGFPTPSRKLEVYSQTLADWGWPEYAIPTYAASQVAPSEINAANNEFCLVATFRLPVLIHTRSSNAKWLAELAHTNPLWLNPDDAEGLGVKTNDLVRVNTQIGYYVLRAWVTEGIRPRVVACSHHMGRWRTHDTSGSGNGRWAAAKVTITQSGSNYLMRKDHGVEPFTSDDPDSLRVWWHDTGVHQNLTFPVQPDPISGAHAWHQRVRLEKAHDGDREGDISVDTNRSHQIYKEWMERTRPAPGPDGLRRPLWLQRPMKPTKEAYQIR
ncbi:MAG: molybdopterin-dependent oxidoreductase [Gemmatimonadetes bacterium]|nr:molybdopterin-dependent oxidoreductase [Gemmatimonadota bacterium]